LDLKISKSFNQNAIATLYKNKQDLKLAFPSARFPVDMKDWQTWIEKTESENFSLLWGDKDGFISHLAIKCFREKPGIVYLCFFIIDEKYRGKGLSSKILDDAYRFVREELDKSELWLVVDPKNKKAFNIYLNEGFKIIDEREAGLRMMKQL